MMIEEGKGAHLPHGSQGAAGSDADELAKVLMKVSHIAAQLNGQPAGFDMTALIVVPQSRGAVDALVLAGGRIVAHPTAPANATK